jgi:tRNA(Ile2) C34 agmatinyltransferase TiaS
MPRKKNLAVTTEVIEATPMTPVAEAITPTCPQCQRELNWRDHFYGGKDGLCKRCHQAAEPSLRIVAFHPAAHDVERGGKLVSVPVRANRATRRRQTSTLPLLTPYELSHGKRHITRAERRATSRTQQAQAHTQVA